MPGPESPADFKPDTFQIRIKKASSGPNSKLGIVADRGDDCIRIAKVETSGLFAKWNKENPRQEIKAGDLVVEVNGVSGRFEDLQALANKYTDLTMEIYHPPPGASAASSRPLDKTSHLGSALFGRPNTVTNVATYASSGSGPNNGASTPYNVASTYSAASRPYDDAPMNTAYSSSSRPYDNPPMNTAYSSSSRPYDNPPMNTAYSSSSRPYDNPPMNTAYTSNSRPYDNPPMNAVYSGNSGPEPMPWQQHHTSVSSTSYAMASSLSYPEEPMRNQLLAVRSHHEDAHFQHELPWEASPDRQIFVEEPALEMDAFGYQYSSSSYQDGFAGQWDRGTITNDCTKYISNSGPAYRVAVNGGNISLLMGDQTYHGTLLGDRIQWSDGDLWQRVVQVNGSAEPPRGPRQRPVPPPLDTPNFTRQASPASGQAFRAPAIATPEQPQLPAPDQGVPGFLPQPRRADFGDSPGSRSPAGARDRVSPNSQQSTSPSGGPSSASSASGRPHTTRDGRDQRPAPTLPTIESDNQIGLQTGEQTMHSIATTMYDDEELEDMMSSVMKELTSTVVAFFGGRQFMHDVITMQDTPKPIVKGNYPCLPPQAPLSAHFKARAPVASSSWRTRKPPRKTGRDKDQQEPESDLVKVILQPGRFGFRGDHLTGVVTEVVPNGQGDQAGVRVGWQCLEIDGIPFTTQLLDDRRKGDSDYVVTFFKDAEQDITFEPRHRLGLVGNWTERGDVVEVTKGKQAEKAGVRIGWKFMKIDGEVFSEERLDAKRHGKASYVITFLKVPQKEPTILPELVWQEIPAFVLLQILACFIIYCGWNTDQLSWATMRLHGLHCEDYRHELWRWWLYQYVHADWGHLFSNCLSILLLGVSVEGFQGHVRMFFMFNVGILGGGAGHIFSRAHQPLIGCSAGVFAILAIHLTDLVLNWSSSIHRVVKLVMLVILTVLIWFPAFEEEPVTSHSAHVGGWLAGLCIGVLAGRNLLLQKVELVLQVVVGAIGGMLIMWVIFWLILWPPLTIWDSTQWCFAAAVHNTSLFQNQAWNCVACKDTSCIASWQSQRNMEVGHFRLYEKCGIEEEWASSGSQSSFTFR